MVGLSITCCYFAVGRIIVANIEEIHRPCNNLDSYEAQSESVDTNKGYLNMPLLEFSPEAPTTIVTVVPLLSEFPWTDDPNLFPFEPSPANNFAPSE